MTGIMMLMAIGSSTPPPTLTCSISLFGGDTYNVSGASGDLYSAFGAYIVTSASGGTPPLSGVNSPAIIKDAGSGTVSLTASGHGSDQTPTWSGMAIGDTILCHLFLNVTDSGTPQQNAQQNYPSAGGSYISIHRAS
jgi:hypothetical protein